MTMQDWWLDERKMKGLRRVVCYIYMSRKLTWQSSIYINYVHDDKSFVCSHSNMVKLIVVILNSHSRSISNGFQLGERRCWGYTLVSSEMFRKLAQLSSWHIPAYHKKSALYKVYKSIKLFFFLYSCKNSMSIFLPLTAWSHMRHQKTFLVQMI